MLYANVSFKPLFVSIPITMPAQFFGNGAIFGGGGVTAWTPHYQPILDSIMRQVIALTGAPHGH